MTPSLTGMLLLQICTHLENLVNISHASGRAPNADFVLKALVTRWGVLSLERLCQVQRHLESG